MNSKNRFNTDSAPVPSIETNEEAFKVPTNSFLSKRSRHVQGQEMRSTNVRLDLKTCQELSDLFQTSKELCLPVDTKKLMARDASSRMGHELHCSWSNLRNKETCESNVDSFAKFSGESERGGIPDNASMISDMNSSFMENVSFLSGITDLSCASWLEEQAADKGESQLETFQGNNANFTKDTSVTASSEGMTTYATLTPVSAVKYQSGYNYINSRINNYVAFPQSTWNQNREEVLIDNRFS